MLLTVQRVWPSAAVKNGPHAPRRCASQHSRIIRSWRYDGCVKRHWVSRSRERRNATSARLPASHNPRFAYRGHSVISDERWQPPPWVSIEAVILAASLKWYVHLHALFFFFLSYARFVPFRCRAVKTATMMRYRNPNSRSRTKKKKKRHGTNERTDGRLRGSIREKPREIFNSERVQRLVTRRWAANRSRCCRRCLVSELQIRCCGRFASITSHANPDDDCASRERNIYGFSEGRIYNLPDARTVALYISLFAPRLRVFSSIVF